MSGREKIWVAERFNRAARDYDEHAVLQKAVAERLLARLDYLRISPSWVLDLGSGTGASARSLAGRYRRARVLHLDLSVAMLATARAQGPRFFSRHAYVMADMEQLPLPANSMDMVYSSLTLQWSHSPDRVFQEVQRVLKPDGLFLFSSLGPDTLKELRASWQAVDDKQHVNIFPDMHEVGDGLLRTGMEDVVMDMEIMTMRYPDCYGLMRDLKLVGANSLIAGRNKGLTGKQKMKAMMQAYENYRREGLLPATYEVVYGHGRKSVRPEQHLQDNVAYISVDSLRRGIRKR